MLRPKTVYRSKRPTSSAKDDSQKEKEELEKIKLRKEIENLSQSFWKKNFGSIVALIIGVLSVSVGIYTGLFDVKREGLKIEKENLAADVREFKSEKETLKNETSHLKNINDSLSNVTASAQKKADSIQHKLLLDSQALNSLKATYSKLNTQYEKLKNFADFPILSITEDFVPTDLPPGIVLKNSGTSVILIEDYKVYTQQKCITVNSLSKALSLLDELNINTDHYIVTHMLPGRRIASGERIVLLGLNKGRFDAGDRQLLYSVLNKICIVVKFKSLTGRKSERIFGQAELANKKCD